MARHLIPLLTAMFLGALVSPLQAQLSEEASVFCDPESESSEAHATLEGACWELDIKCDGAASGEASLTLSGAASGDWDFFALSEPAACEKSGSFAGAEKIEVKCELPDGEVEAEAKSVDPEACEEEEEEE